MSKFDSAVKKEKNTKKFPNAVENFMGGISYELDPLETLKMISASSIMGEPQYYRNGEFAPKTAPDAVFHCNPLLDDYLIFDEEMLEGKKTSDIMEEAIDKALDFDFNATLDWAVTLRKDFLMRLNPQVIMVRAAIHPKREEFTKRHPGKFAEINSRVMSRADEPSSQLAYYLYKNNGNKNNLPNILKKSWAKRFEKMTPYEFYKYRNSGVGMIDTIRICHANSKTINELMKTGTVDLERNEKTWETLRADKTPWKEILSTVRVGHMALLRNLRGIAKEGELNTKEFTDLLEQLKDGVKQGKQFPFRYYTAYKIFEHGKLEHSQMVADALEECIDIACENMPKLKGKTMCLSDNSGSAWGTCNSEYGSVKVANIDNLSAAIMARNSDEGFVGKFGDELHEIPISKRDGILGQVKNIEKNDEYRVGGSTENGIWLFFDKAIREKEHYDNIVIFSDMQAGHGGLYGTSECCIEYAKKGFAVKNHYIDVAKLIEAYRKEVNPKVNVMCVQTAGYDNVLIPEIGYRMSVCYGWTGKELVYLDEMNRQWDAYDERIAQKEAEIMAKNEIDTKESVKSRVDRAAEVKAKSEPSQDQKADVEEFEK